MRAKAAPHSYSGVLDSFTAHQTNSTSAPLLMCLLTCLPPQQFSRKLSQSAQEKGGEKEAAAECVCKGCVGLLTCTGICAYSVPGSVGTCMHVDGGGVYSPVRVG